MQTNVDALHRRRLTFEQFRVSPSSCVRVLAGKLIDSVAVLSGLRLCFTCPAKGQKSPSSHEICFTRCSGRPTRPRRGEQLYPPPLFFVKLVFCWRLTATNQPAAF